ncbi:MAG: orotidine-5'-phosphate decarboxylase [Gemmatimonadaceae bacterium]
MSVIPMVALDVSAVDAALQLADALGDSCRYYKVGSELFTTGGPAVVRALRERGHEVFLDLKLHDIPNTVRSAARAAARLGVSLLTVHAVGGETMIRAAVEGADSGAAEGGSDACGILAVTVLTSLDRAALAGVWGRDGGLALDAEVLRLASVAASAGAHGIVCSGAEVGLVDREFRGRLAPLVPGIRFAEGAAHDQARVVTPRAAAAAGARYLVLGRAVTASGNPVAAMARVWEELEEVTGSAPPVAG